MSARLLALALLVCACKQPPPPPTSTAQEPPSQPAPVAVETPPPPPPSGGAPMPWMPPELVARGGPIVGEYLIDRRVDPSWLQGDFDGDGAQDWVVSVWREGEVADKTPPHLVVLRAVAGEGRDVWLKDDALLSIPGRDSWRVHPKATPVPVGHDGKPGPKLLGDAFVVARNESSSALIYWDGKRFRSHFLTD